MPHNYILSSLRFLKRNKLFATINMLGLSIALSVSFIILLYVVNEYSYNASNNNKDKIVQLLFHDLIFNSTNAKTPYVLANHLNQDLPQIDKVARSCTVNDFKIFIQGDYVNVRRTVGSDSNIFSVFDLTLTGQESSVLQGMDAIVLSKEYANMLFPGENPIGKMVQAKIYGKAASFIIKAVFDDIPINSTFKADCFVNEKWVLDDINKRNGKDDAFSSWHSTYWDTWLLLSEDYEDESLDQLLDRVVTMAFVGDKWFKLSAQPFSDLYLRSAAKYGNGVQGNLEHIQLFSAIGLLIVIVATFNYIILSTAVSVRRLKEIGIRKACGSSVFRIRFELLFESLFLSLMVLPFALLFTSVGMPFAERLFKTELIIISSNIPIYIFTYFLLTMIVGLLSGLYTSSYLARLNVVNVFVSKMTFNGGKSKVKSVLLVFQLGAFCMLLSAAMIVYKQYEYAINKDLGFRNDNILQIDLGHNFKNYSAFIKAVSSFPETISIGGSMGSLPFLGGASWLTNHFSNNTQVTVESFVVDYGFIETMGFDVLEGRSFNREQIGDNNTIVINETAARKLGIEHPIGKVIDGYTIIGVVKDFTLHTIYSKIPPMGLFVREKSCSHLAIRYVPGHLKALLSAVKTKWEELAPGNVLKYELIEDRIRHTYSKEKELGEVFAVAAFLAMFIATMGLWGLSMFVSETHTKETGIRKLHGGSTMAIVQPLLRKYFMMLFVAICLATPVTIFGMQKWLSKFSDAIEIDWWIFILTFMFASLIILLTIIYYAYKVYQRNPIEALRYE